MYKRRFSARADTVGRVGCADDNIGCDSQQPTTATIDSVEFYDYAMAAGDVGSKFTVEAASDCGNRATPIGCSAVTCAGLAETYGEWPIDNTCTDIDSDQVCGESDAGMGPYSLVDNTRAKACLGGITDTDQGDDEATDGWNHASTICTSLGARLCSIAELQADETRCTGCQVQIVACKLILIAY